MKVDDVETRDVLKDKFHLPDVMGQCLAATFVVPQGSGACRNEPGIGL
jgi:hypothetical protein